MKIEYMIRLFILSVLLILFGCNSSKEKSSSMRKDEVLISVWRTNPEAGDTARIAIDWEKLSKYLPELSHHALKITDQHFGLAVPGTVVDINGDDNADYAVINYEFPSAEPVYTFKLQADTTNGLYVFGTSEFQLDESLIVKILLPYSTQQDTIESWPRYIFGSSMITYPNPVDLTIISPATWTYEYGLFLGTGVALYERTHDKIYLEYVKQWVDYFVGDDGQIRTDKYEVTKYRLDDILPGRLCIFLYQATGDIKYKLAADQLIDHLKHQPKTTEGGYWHKEIYPHQMWLDGIYMADVFSMQYANVFNQPHWYDEAALQVKLIAKHHRDPKTGLFYHGWDEAKNKVWADSLTGRSPAFWGRAIGWYMMAMADCLEYLPKEHTDYDSIVSIFTNLSKTLLQYQDPQSHLWFQVIDKGNLQGNWIETSCSAMFAYAYAKGVRLGLLDESYRMVGKDVTTWILKNYTYYDDSGIFYLDQTVKVGTLNIKSSKGDYEYYIQSERRINDYKGISPLIYALLELE